MKLLLTEKDTAVLKVISQVAGGFTLVVALTMLFSFVQLKIIKPLDNPVLVSVKEQYDKDPANASKAAQVRAMDLMARKAYFSSRWQVETGSYLLIAGAIIFILCQRLISNNEKIKPVLPGSKTESSVKQKRNRQYLLYAASFTAITAVGASFLIRDDLPDLSNPASPQSENTVSSGKRTKSSVFKPDKTNYPFFRGQDSRGIAGGSGYPTKWDGTSGKNIAWKSALPKRGKSSPVIWEDKLFVTGGEGKVCEVYCINKKNGELLWTGIASGIQGEPSELPKMDPEGGLAVSTAATNGKVVCVVFSNGNLACFDMNGKHLWSKNIGVPESSYGYTSSLIIYEDLLLVQFDSNSKLSLIGFETETGNQKWETIRSGRAVWSSPVIAELNGVTQLIINGNPMVSAYDPVTGKELWAVECMSGDVAPSVAVNSKMAYAVTDYAKLAAIIPGPPASVVWDDNTFTPDASSPVATDDFLFISTGTGDVACYNSEKGDTLWTHYFSDQFYASPIIADDKIYLLDRGGVMHILEADSKYKLIDESALGELTDCTPAFSDKQIFIRGSKNLYCISEK